MKKIDYLSLDSHSLLTFMTVLEELSVSRAAKRLAVTQSAVGHTLTKLRLAIGDPLFVRSGRGISATAQATFMKGTDLITAEADLMWHTVRCVD